VVVVMVPAVIVVVMMVVVRIVVRHAIYSIGSGTAAGPVPA
jgi:hypothetical protein